MFSVGPRIVLPGDAPGQDDPRPHGEHQDHRPHGPRRVHREPLQGSPHGDVRGRRRRPRRALQADRAALWQDHQGVPAGGAPRPAVPVHGLGRAHARRLDAVRARGHRRGGRRLDEPGQHPADGGQHAHRQLGQDDGRRRPQRLAARPVLRRQELLHLLPGFNTCYKDTGLWGVYFVCDKLNLENMIYNIQMEWMRLCTTVSDFEVQRAKDLLKTNMLLQLDGTTSVCEDIGRQMLCYGRRIPQNEMEARIDAVDADLVRQTCYNFVYDKCPVVAAVGPTENLPDYNRMRAGMYWLRV